MTSATETVFEALVVPHRSVTGKGIATLLAVLTLFSAGVALRLWFFRAPLAVAFVLFEIPMVAALLWANMRHARASELVTLTLDELSVVRSDWRGRKTRRSLPTAWLRVDLEDDKGTRHLVARSHGQGFEIGSFLHDSDKYALSQALRRALWDVKNPRFGDTA